MWLLTVGLIGGAVVLLDTAVWALACRRLDDGARDAVRAAGWVLEGSPARWGGWPVAAAVTLDDAVLRAGPDIVPPLTWTVPSLQLRLPAWSPATLTLQANGRQRLAIGTAPPVPFEAADLRARLDLLDRVPPRIDATGLTAAGPTGPVQAGAVAVTLQPDGWMADLADLTIPGRDGRPVSPAIAALRFTMRVSPPIPALPTARESAQAWRARDGRVGLQVDELHWGELRATGRGTLRLDPALQPDIEATVAASGLPAALSQLADTGAIGRNPATAAMAMLTILGGSSGNGTLTLPVSVADGVVSIARFPLLRLLPLQWD